MRLVKCRQVYCRFNWFEIDCISKRIYCLVYGVCCRGAFWTDGFYSNTVSQFGGEKVIMRYIQNQGKEDKKYKSNYKSIYKNQSESLFET
jgi:REP element-mobilizing transposase RayT